MKHVLKSTLQSCCEDENDGCKVPIHTGLFSPQWWLFLQKTLGTWIGPETKPKSVQSAKRQEEETLLPGEISSRSEDAPELGG